MARTILATTGTQSRMTFQSLEIDGKPLVRRHSPAPSTSNECACSVSFSCPDPTWSGGQFRCHSGNNCTAGTVVWRATSLVTSCSVIETGFASDFRCFFDQTCVNTILPMHNVDMPDRLPLPSTTLAITALDSSAPSAFLPTDPMETIFGKLMIEEWQVDTNFDDYYNSCTPATCTYKVYRQVDLLYIVTILVSLFGGLVVVFRLLVPVVVRLLYRITIRWCDRHSDTNSQEHPQLPGE